MNENELELLCPTNSEQLLTQIMAHKYSNLFMLYAQKFGFTLEELEKTYDHTYGRESEVYIPLQYAAFNGDAEVVCIILATEGVDKQGVLTKKDAHGRTVLYSIYIEVVRVILTTEGVDKLALLEVTDNYGCTPLQTACTCDFKEIVSAILATAGDNKQNLLAKTNMDGWNSLHRACSNGCIGVVREILTTEGVDTNALITATDNNGNTPLHLAIAANNLEAGKIEIVKMLLAHGANPSLMMLIRNSSTPGVNSVLRSHAYVHCKTFLSNVLSSVSEAVIYHRDTYLEELTIPHAQQERSRQDTNGNLAER